MGGGEAVLLPDGQTVSCTLSYRGFPSVAAAGTVLTEGKWYYEAMVLTDGLMQIGWCDTKFEGNSTHGEGVGDDTHSIAYDGKRKLKWHNGRSQPFGERWKAGDVVCCAANLDDGVVQFALNGKWNDRSTAFDSLIFHDGLMPAASFSKGEKLCFNFGSSANNGFVHSPPDEEYLPVYIAQGNVNTMEKMEKMMQEQQEKKGKAKSAGKKPMKENNVVVVCLVMCQMKICNILEDLILLILHLVYLHLVVLVFIMRRHRHIPVLLKTIMVNQQ